MKVKELRDVLEEAESILSAAGAKVPSKDFRIFVDLFKGHDDRPVADFLAELRGRLNGRQPQPKYQPKAVDEMVVTHYVKRLRDSGTDQYAFEGIQADLSNDSRVGKSEADAIAHLYTGGREKWPSKSEAMNAIADWFTHEAYQAVKMKRVDKATPL
jgi:hypothetical protein